jgi:ketosteroid isomerase-like protein
MRALFSFGLLSFTVMMACQPAAPADLSDADRASIKQGEDAWVRLTNAKDWTAAAQAYWTADAVVLPPNSPAATGQSGIVTWLSGFPPFSDFTLEQVAVEGRGDLAYVHGTYSLMVTPPGASAPIRDQGKHVTVWKKQPDGTWKASLGIFNSNLPLPTPEPAKK